MLLHWVILSALVPFRPVIARVQSPRRPYRHRPPAQLLSEAQRNQLPLNGGLAMANPGERSLALNLRLISLLLRKGSHEAVCM